MTELNDVFRLKAPPRQREITVEAVTSEQHLGCAYCGWQIGPGQRLTVVVLGDQLRFYCHDHEQCVKQAGK